MPGGAVFKKSDEQEWSRFRSGGAREREELAEHPDTGTGSQAASQGYPGATVSPSSRPPGGDVNVSVSTRSGRSSAGDGGEVESLIGEKTSVEGTVKAAGAIRVCGTVQGEIESAGSVYIDERARVKAVVRGASVTIAGHVDGEIHSQGRVEIRATGHVVGDISAGALIIQEGAFFDGTSKMAGADASETSGEQPPSR